MSPPAIENERPIVIRSGTKFQVYSHLLGRSIRRQIMKTLATTMLFLLLVDRSQAEKLEWTNPEGLGKNPQYSQVVKAGKLLFIAGQIGITAEGKVVGPGMKQQYE